MNRDEDVLADRPAVVPGFSAWLMWAPILGSFVVNGSGGVCDDGGKTGLDDPRDG